MRDICITWRIHQKDFSFLAACVAVGWGIGVVTALLCLPLRLVRVHMRGKRGSRELLLLAESELRPAHRP